MDCLNRLDSHYVQQRDRNYFIRRPDTCSRVRCGNIYPRRKNGHEFNMPNFMRCAVGRDNAEGLERFSLQKRIEVLSAHVSAFLPFRVPPERLFNLNTVKPLKTELFCQYNSNQTETMVSFSIT